MNGRRCISARIRSGDVRRKDVNRRLGELAFGRVNDCVKLALGNCPDLDALDLTLLSEIKRNEKGTVEVKLVDRLKVLEQLAQITGEDDGQVEAFLQAMQAGADT